jgi:HAE1 family hydrophobic/amphiphilic exporter-1
MSNPVITFPLRRPVLTTVIYIIVIIVGLFSLWRLPIDLMPEITNPTITVMTSYSNAGPQEVEELITRLIESSLAGVQGIQEISSNSSEGRSRVRASFVWGTNLDEAIDDIRDRLDRIVGRLPDDVERPMIRKFDVSASPIMFIGVSSDLDPADVRQLIEDQVQYRLERVDGVASVDLWGGSRKEVHVTLSAPALKALNISPDMVVNSIRQENRNIPAGSVEQGFKDVTVRTLAEYTTINDLENTVIAVKDGVPVTIGDVAAISDGLQEITSIVRINGQPGFRLAISKQSGINTVAVAGGIRKEIDRINKDFPQIKIVPLTDTSKFIQQAIGSVGNSLVLGGAIAVIILLLFLRNLSSTFIIATVIPVSIIATFSLIYFGGLTLNMMTFGGLALGIGMLVDNAIVVLDNIFHHREKGEEPNESAIKGASEVTSAVIASTLTTLVVFFPVIFIRGISGIMFRQLAYVVSFSLACSLVAALTLVPVLTSRFLKLSRSDSDRVTMFSKLFELSERWYRDLETAYGKVIDWVLNHRKTVVVGSIIVLIGSILMIPVVGQELMPKTDEGEVRVDVELEAGTRMELTDIVMQKIEAILTREVPEAVYILTSVGNGNTGDISVSLVPKNERKRSSVDIANVLRRTIVGIPGATVRIREGRGLFAFRMGSNGAQSVDIELRGHDLVTGQQLAQALSEKVKEISGITDVRISREAGLPEYILRIDRKKAADLGLTATQIGTAVRTGMDGTQVTSIWRDGKEYSIIVRLEENQKRTISQLTELTVINKSGVAIPIQAVTQVSETLGPLQIERRDRERIITLGANYSGRNLGAIVTDIRNVVSKVTVPPDYTVLVRGDYEEQQKAQRELLVGLAMAVMLIYLVMAGQFESFKDPFIILFAIPMALVGVVLMLFLTATPFSMQAYIGCIVLAGIVVNNAIVLVDYMNRLRREKGVQLRDAIKEAGIRRLRPILMTAFTTALGLLPLALALGEGGETQAPMARVVIGGLLSSTFITLLLIPVIYSLVEERHEKKNARKRNS